MVKRYPLHKSLSSRGIPDMEPLNLINLFALRCTLSILLVPFIHPDTHSDHCFKAFNPPVLTTRYLQKPWEYIHCSFCSHYCRLLILIYSSGVMTYISLAAFDILATSLVTNRMMQAIRGCNGFRKVARQNLSEYVLRSGVLYFGYGFPIVTRGIISDFGMSRVVTTPQIIAVVLYFVPQGWIKSSFTTFEPRHGSYRSGDFRDSTALSSATFSCLREMNESKRESIPDEASLAGHYAVHI
ncbi:hypothetical protein LENED_007787 [Lentinula edodes]|uniref:Uncharacterized protein n=1 Tax=Lentinula edodes TaxID=5353 RepID=A0A1Q3EFC1_LENED|nr:hypothetical protein LENED_007787 [Lentinula edodes]